MQDFISTHTDIYINIFIYIYIYSFIYLFTYLFIYLHIHMIDESKLSLVSKRVRIRLDCIGLDLDDV